MLDIIIPSYNPKHLTKVVSSLISSEIVNKIIIVEDNSNHRKQIEEVDTLEKVEVIKNEKNCGQGVSRNRGFSFSKIQKVLFLDDDTLLTKNTVSQIDYLLDLYDAIIFFTIILEQIVLKLSSNYLKRE